MKNDRARARAWEPFMRQHLARDPGRWDSVLHLNLRWPMTEAMEAARVCVLHINVVCDSPCCCRH